MLHTYTPFAQEAPYNLRPFSFRSEGPADAMWFLAQVAQKAVMTNCDENTAYHDRLFFSELFIETCPRTHECIVEFQSNVQLEDMRTMLRSDFEKRIMLETLRQLPAHENSMKRDLTV